MSGLSGMFASSAFDNFITYGFMFIWILFGGIILAIAAYFIIMIMRFKFSVIILETVGDSVRIIKDRGALLKDKETGKVYRFRLLKKKVNLPPPPADSIVFGKKGAPVVMLAQISPTDFISVKPHTDLTKNEVSLIPIDQDCLFWYVNALERQNEKYANEVKWWQNPYVMGFATLALCLIILIITFKYAGSWQSSAKSAALEVANVFKSSVGQTVG